MIWTHEDSSEIYDYIICYIYIKPEQKEMM